MHVLWYYSVCMLVPKVLAMNWRGTGLMGNEYEDDIFWWNRLRSFLTGYLTAGIGKITKDSYERVKSEYSTIGCLGGFEYRKQNL